MLTLRAVDAWYGRVRVLSAVSLGVAPGELVTIVGANGSGKTTLLRVVTGLVPARSGTITLAGAPITGLPTEAIVRRGVAMAPEGRELFGPLTVGENLLLGAYGLPGAARREGALDTLEVRVEASPELAEAGPEAVRGLAGQVRRRIHEHVGLTTEVTVVPPRTIERSAGKAKRIEDLRRPGR